MLSEKSRIVNYIGNNHPNFLIIPFEKEDVFKNQEISKRYNFNLEKILQKRYPEKFITITSSARKSLDLILKQILHSNSIKNVNINTTSNNKYISSCVTDTIEDLGLKWNRDNKPKHNITLVNHEFGYVNQKINTFLSKRDFLIEDCAFSFNSKYRDNELCGTKAAYSLFSFSKYFPIQVGGCIVSDSKIFNNDDDPNVIKYINSVVGYYYDQIDEWSEYRLHLKKYYNSIFTELGMYSYFKFSENNIPGVYLFKLNDEVNTLDLKKYFWDRGVQCTVFYGESAFYLPLNQKIKKEHVDYFFDMLIQFLKKNNL